MFKKNEQRISRINPFSRFYVGLNGCSGPVRACMRLLFIVWALYLKHGVNRMTNETNDSKDVSGKKADSKPAYPDFLGRIPLKTTINTSVSDKGIEKARELVESLEEEHKEHIDTVYVHHAGLVKFKLSTWADLSSAIEKSALDIIKDVEDVIDDDMAVQVRRGSNHKVVVKVSFNTKFKRGDN